MSKSGFNIWGPKKSTNFQIDNQNWSEIQQKPSNNIFQTNIPKVYNSNTYSNLNHNNFNTQENKISTNIFTGNKLQQVTTSKVVPESNYNNNFSSQGFNQQSIKIKHFNYPISGNKQNTSQINFNQTNEDLNRKSLQHSIFNKEEINRKPTNNISMYEEEPNIMMDSSEYMNREEPEEEREYEYNNIKGNFQQVKHEKVNKKINFEPEKEKKKIHIKSKKKPIENENYYREENDYHVEEEESNFKKPTKRKLKAKKEDKKPEENVKSKPKIELNKLKELENKRRELVDKLEREERVRSPSPESINLIKPSEEQEKEVNLDDYKPKNMTNFPKTAKARLNFMCNPKEIKDREEQNLLNVFEADPESSYYDSSQKRNILRVKPDFAIKVFARPAADTVMDDPENIRTPEVLTYTINYLLNDILDTDTDKTKMDKFYKPVGIEINFENISKFVEDRFRSIRQDFTILNLKGNKNNIEGHEKIARFLILCLNETLDYDAFSGQQSLFKLYVQQLNATLTSLREFYDYVNLNRDNDKSCYSSPNQAEFYAYSILLSIKEKFDLVSMLNKMPEYIVNSEIITLTKKVVRSIMGNNWISFFTILKSKECGYLLSCVMSLYFKEMRVAALSELSHAYGISIKDKYYSTTISKLSDMLLFEDETECIDFLNWFGNDTSFYDKNCMERKESIFGLMRTGLEGEDANLPRKANRRFIEIKKLDKSRKDLVAGTSSTGAVAATAKTTGEKEKTIEKIEKKPFLDIKNIPKLIPKKEIFNQGNALVGKYYFNITLK